MDAIATKRGATSAGAASEPLILPSVFGLHSTARRATEIPRISTLASTHDAQRVLRGFEAGAVDFLFKPIDPILLGHKVTTLVDLHRKRLECEKVASDLREMLRLNETFVAAVSHDLRSPR